MMISVVLVAFGNFSTSRFLCFFSITKIKSAHSTIFSDTLILALFSVPADRTCIPDMFLKIISAVGLRHWLRLQMKRRFKVLVFTRYKVNTNVGQATNINFGVTLVRRKLSRVTRGLVQSSFFSVIVERWQRLI